MKTILRISIVLLFACPTTILAQSYSKPICLQITGEDFPYNLDSIEGSNAQKIEKTFPDAEVISVRFSTWQGLTDSLKGIISVSDRIACMIISAHGSPDTILASGDPLHLASSGAVEKVFSPILKNFLPGVSVVFQSCRVIAEGTREQKRRRMQLVARNFNIKTGSIYMNEYNYSPVYNGPISQTFQSQKTLKEKIYVLGTQLFAPIAYPTLMAKDWFGNRGYKLKIGHSGIQFEQSRYKDSL